VALNLWCTVAWTAAATVVLARFLAVLGLGGIDALLGALAYAFGTLVFPYDASIWGHTTAAACLLSALCLAAWPGGPRCPWLAGALGGLAVLVEYTAAFGLAAAGWVFLTRTHGWRRLVRFLAGAAPPLLALLGVHKLAFGGFFTTAVQLSNPALLDGSRELGLFGRIDPAAVWGMLFSAWRGLFVYSPILLFAFVGAWQHWKRGERVLGAACLTAFVACVLLASTLNPWWGGGSRGTRYLIVALPMLAVLAPRLSALPRRLRTLHAAALALSVSNMLVLATLGVLGDEAGRRPLYGVLYRAALSGETFDHVNVGMLLGLDPRGGLALFLLLFGPWTVLLLRRASPPRLRPGA
jgi:hypothetical protein